MTTPQELSGQLGRYRIVRKLGEGGMGAVYLAEDTRLLRKVALKVPHFTAADGTALARFRREAAIAAHIEHPNLCPVHDLEEVNGVLFFTMPYIEGKLLSHPIERGQPWPVARAVELVRKIAGAVAHLHAHGIIHRDLKPANVMLRPSGEPVLMDFGLAREVDSQRTRLTKLGALMGSPSYMAPEQVAAEKDMGPAVDVYALGVILFQLLTGRLPFEAPVPALFLEILQDPPSAPSSFNGSVERRLEAVCLRALNKDPAARQKSVQVFQYELAAAVATITPVPSAVSATQAALPFPPTVSPSMVGTAEPPRMNCPKCGKAVRVPEGLAGSKVKCPHCGSSLGWRPAAVTQAEGRIRHAETALIFHEMIDVVRRPARRRSSMGLLAAVLLAIVAVSGAAFLLGRMTQEGDGGDRHSPPPESKDGIAKRTAEKPKRLPEEKQSTEEPKKTETMPQPKPGLKPEPKPSDGSTRLGFSPPLLKLLESRCIDCHSAKKSRVV